MEKTKQVLWNVRIEHTSGIANRQVLARTAEIAVLKALSVWLCRHFAGELVSAYANLARGHNAN